jgi:LysM repeat protein
MKRIGFWLPVISIALVFSASAQDAATEERLNKLSGQIEDIIATQRAQQKHIEALAKEIESLREHMSKPTAAYATPDDLKRVAEAVKDVDRKRMEDSEKISTQLAKLGKTLAAPAPANKKSNSTAGTEGSSPDKPLKDEKGFPYTIQSGDTLSVIIQAYKEKNIKVTTDQILKANPGLKPEKLKPGQKIWIPAPQA